MPPPVLAAELDRRLARALEPVSAVRVAYLFGSRARGDERSDSDLDLAVAYPRELEAWDREQARRDVVGALATALGRLGEEADVVDLDRAFSAVAFDAVARGRCILARSEDDRVEVEVRVVRRYHDDEPLRECQRKVAAQAFRT